MLACPQQPHDVGGGVLQSVEILHQHLGTRAHVGRPAVELGGGIDVGEADDVVEALHVRLVDGTDVELACPDVVLANEVGKRQKGVITGELNEDWYFYNLESSIFKTMQKTLWHR